MILSNKFEILNGEGDINPQNSARYTRESNGSYYSQLVTQGVTSIYDNVELDFIDNSIVLKKSDDENKSLNSIYIGEDFGVIHGSTVQLNVIFLDDALCVEIEKGFINIGDSKDDFFVLSHLSEEDQMLLDSDKPLLTEWLTTSQLKSMLNSLIKDDYEVVETMFQLQLSVEGGVLSTKTLSTKDLSNGMVDQKKQEKREAELEKQRQRELKLKEIQQKKQEQIELQEKEEAKVVAEQGNEVRNMFKALIG